MKKIIILLSLFLFAGMLLADWFPGDGYKMHYPQLPDPNGWDVNCTYPNTVADDWQCTESGPVEDIHVWISWEGDREAQIDSVYFSIHEDFPDPDGPGPEYSMPGVLLWDRWFYPSDFMYITYGTGDQGWADPPTIWNRPDHTNYYQINVEFIPDPFIQNYDEIYWLDVSIAISQTGQEEQIGWKTSLDHFNDDSVFWDFSQSHWVELIDPLTQESLDQAFVITGDSPPTPVELSSFTAFYDEGSPTLDWTTQSESNNIGWNVYRSNSENIEESFQVNGNLIPGAGTTSEPTEYTFIDQDNVEINNTYWYWIENRDESGNTNTYGPISLTIPESGNNPDAPIIEGSIRNYPNPFYPQTEIKFNLPEPANVEVTVYNTKGQKVQTLYNGYCIDEKFSTTWNAENLTSGIYMYVVKVGDITSSGKMILTK